MQPVYVLFGTESGNAQGLAKRTGEALEAAGVQSKVIDMMDFEAPDLTSVRILLVVTSTYGNGDPPSNAETVHGYLMRKCPPLPDLKFSVCGLGDTTYERFANCGKDFDRRLAELGATRLYDRKDCDVDYEAPFEEWLEQVVPVVRSVIAGSDAVTAVAPPIAEHKHVDAPGTRRRPVLSRVIRNVNLNGAGSTKETRHVELGIAGLPIAYEVGDSIGIWPDNHPALITQLLGAVQLEGHVKVTLGGQQMSLTEALTKRCELQHPDVRLAEHALGPLAPEQRQAAVDGYHVIDLLLESTKPVSAQQLVDMLRPMAPRLYSIASSRLAHPDQVHITADILRYEMRGRQRMGVTSRQIVGKAAPGTPLSIYLHPSPSFRLAAPDKDIVMIGPGTGIAPFRAFLEERRARGDKGRSWLFFGSRNEKTDFLYGDELRKWVEQRALARLDLAFSRDTADKVYVQHRMREAQKDLREWIRGGAVVYVCGDAKKMAPDVHRALIEILADGASEDAARAELEAMTADGRYQRDVY